MAKKTAKKTSEIKEALELLAREKNVAIEEVFSAFKESLIQAARRYTKLHKNIEVDVDPVTEEIKVVLRVEVVDDFPDYDSNLSAAEVEKLDEHYMLEEQAKEYHSEAEAGYMLEVELPFENFGRLAIQEARQRLKQRVNDVERNRIFEIYRNKVGTLINGQVLRIEKNNAIISIGSNIEAALPNNERMSKDRWKIGQSVKAVISGVSKPSEGVGMPIKGIGAQVTLSRVSKEFLGELFKQEIPEVYDGTIEIKGIARIPGYRAKVAVFSRDDRVDPSGACIGVKGQRIQAITRELNNERIDVVHWDPDPDVYLRRALGATGNINIVKTFEVPGFNPPRIIVVVGDEDVGIVIGDKGQSVRLTSMLLGKDICVFGESDWASHSEEEKEALIHSQDPRTVVKKAASLDMLFNNSKEITEKLSPGEI